MQASAQYNDLVGTVAADLHNWQVLWDLAARNGIDPDRYFPIGLSIYQADVSMSGSLILVDMGGPGKWTGEQAAERAQEPDAVKKVLIDIDEDFRTYFKRLSIVMARQNIDLANIAAQEKTPGEL